MKFERQRSPRRADGSTTPVGTSREEPAVASSPKHKNASRSAKPASKSHGKAPAKSAAKPTSKSATKHSSAVSAKKPPAKQAAGKSAATKAASAAKATAAKSTPAKSVVKPAGKAPPAPIAKGATKASATPATVVPKAAQAQAAAAPAAADAGKKGPKGITIVNPKQVRKNKPKVKLEMPKTEPLIKPGQKWKPLIQSGPKAPPSQFGAWKAPGAESETEFKIDPKAKLPKKDLEKYREVLMRKRSELLGDITTIEDEALRTNSGSLSALPQHMAEQGSDTYDQHLSLDLAQVDRNLLREIEAALERIRDGTYGVCLKTGKRISAERLAELPWARYSIEAAREMERRPHITSSSASASAASSASSMDND